MPTRRSIALFAAALISTIPLPGASLRAQTTVTSERPASFALDNGLLVGVIPDHRTPVLTQIIW